MKLTFLYAPTQDLRAGLAFYRDTLGWSEAWREGDTTVAFHLPGSDVQVMVSQEDDPPGPMFQVESVAEFLAARPELTVRVETRDIPDGSVAGVEDPGGNLVYIFDQARESNG